MKMHPVTFLCWILVFYHVDAIRNLRHPVDRQLQTTIVGQIENLRLINADTDLPIFNLSSNLLINLHSMNATNLSIQATTVVNSGIVGSIRFAHNGNSRVRTDSTAPFSMCLTIGGKNYQSCTVLGIGNHTVTATPYAKANATGAIGIPYQVTFQIVNVPPTLAPTKIPTSAPTKAPTQTTTVGQIENLRLINTDTDQPISNLSSNLLINLHSMNATSLSIQATTIANSGIVGSIRFAHNGNNRVRTDSAAPFSMCPTIGGKNYQSCTVLGIGVHIVTATPYAKANATGAIGIPYQITFQIVNVPPTLAPTKVPTAAPVSLCRVPQFMDESWQSFPPKYPIKNGEPQGLLVGDDLVIFGGFTNSFTIATNNTYARDLTGNISSAWRRMDDMPLVSGITHAATVAVGLKVYLCGGYHGPHPGPHVPYCFVYDHSKAPGTGQWSNFTFLPNGGTAGAGMIYDSVSNMLYYTGGGQRLIPNNVHPVDVNSTWKISLSDPSTGWVASTPIPYLANHLSYVTHRDALGAERHFFLAGQKQEFESNGNLADNYEFIAASETWIRRADMPFPRGHAAASTRAIGCGFIIAGGSANSNSTRKNRIADVSYYDIPSDTWTAGIGMLPHEGSTPIVVIHPNGYMHFVNASPNSSRRRITS